MFQSICGYQVYDNPIPNAPRFVFMWAAIVVLAKRPVRLQSALPATFSYDKLVTNDHWRRLKVKITRRLREAIDLVRQDKIDEAARLLREYEGLGVGLFPFEKGQAVLDELLHVFERRSFQIACDAYPLTDSTIVVQLGLETNLGASY